MARTKQALKTNTKTGSSFYRKLTPKLGTARLGTNYHDDEYSKLLADLKEQLTRKFESELEQTLQKTAANLKAKSLRDEQEEDYDQEVGRQHQHPSWPWEPVEYTHHRPARRNERPEPRKKDYDEPEEIKNDWRQLTQYKNEPEPNYERAYKSWTKPIDGRDEVEANDQPENRYRDLRKDKPVMAYTNDEKRDREPVNQKGKSAIESDLQALKDKIVFLEKELMASYQRESSLKNSVEKLEQEVSSKQAGFSMQLDTLKKDVLAPNPEVKKDENKLTSLSMQLSQVMQSMNTMMNDEQPTETPSATPVAVDEVAEKVNQAKTDEKKVDNAVKSEDKSKEGPKSAKNKKKKILWMFASLVLILGGIGAGVLFFFNGKTEVDPELIKNYAPESTTQTPAPDQSSNKENGQTALAERGEVQGAATSTSPPSESKDQSFADVAYGETRWDTYKNPQLGVQFDYPSNSTNVVRTDNSVTVVRKTGYIFKVQHIQSALELKDYWNQIKARNLVYKVSEKTFRDLPALYLELDDKADYPGNRYLVKKNDIIYDIWYATVSNTLSDDDAKRIDVILNSFKFME